MKVVTTLMAMTLTLVLTACGTDAQTGSSLADADDDLTSVVPGTFKTYDRPRKNPSPHCDVHTKVELVNGFAGALANLKNTVEGACEIHVQPNERNFNLAEVKGEETACGTKVYAGETSDLTEIYDPKRVVKIEIVDHRARICRDVVEAQLIVKETLADGRVVTRYTRH